MYEKSIYIISQPILWGFYFQSSLLFWPSSRAGFFWMVERFATKSSSNICLGTDNLEHDVG